MGNWLILVRALCVVVWRQGVMRPSRDAFWKNLWLVKRANPERFATYLAICAQAEHFIPLTRIITREMEAQIAELANEVAPLQRIAQAPPPVLRKPVRVKS
jgi:hypothetical protein